MPGSAARVKSTGAVTCTSIMATWVLSSTVANRPTLNVSYCYAVGPTISTAGTLNAFSSSPGVPSAQQSYTVSGSNLTDNITVTPPAIASASKCPGCSGLWRCTRR